jgi:membrane protein
MFTWIRKRAWPIVVTTLTKWYEDDGDLLSAAMAYYAALSLFPLCLVLVAALGLVSRFSPQFQNEQQRLLQVVAENIDPWLADQLSRVLAGVRTNATVGGPVGVVTLILAAIVLFHQFESLFDRVWHLPQPARRGIVAVVRDALYDRLIAFLMLLAVGAMLIVIFVADIVISAIRSYALQLPAGGYAWAVVQLGVTLSSSALLFTVIYKVFPRVRVRWREAFAGGVLVAVILRLGFQALESLLIGERYSVYGVVGSFIAILLWIYYASAMIFLGAEFLQTICESCSPQRPADAASDAQGGR